ncbi:unnamed protein product [Cuscuta epithymum]|uniref:Peptidase A1 domain-containing protein n=1 Tax=Cuscuta epithymum TaxID=186058 RepID=A0AAV0DFH2_9ASTE|nr:unnamed protein product [Cuscuta epithymum]
MAAACGDLVLLFWLMAMSMLGMLNSATSSRRPYDRATDLSHRQGVRRLGASADVSPSIGGHDEDDDDNAIGAFLVDVEVGTPAVRLQCRIDTAADLTFIAPDSWSRYKITSASSSFSKYPCCPAGVFKGLGDPCAAVSTNKSAPGGGCQVRPFDYNHKRLVYNTYSTLAGESFAFGQSRWAVSNLPFLLADDHFDQPAERDDGSICWVGLGRGNMSLISRLNLTQFSYLFTGPGRNRLISLPPPFSRPPPADGVTVTTPLVNSPYSSNFYYISLKGISVGKTPLDVAEEVFQLNSNGSGGMIMNSRASFTYLPLTAFDALCDEVAKQLDLTDGLNKEMDASGGRVLCLPTTTMFPNLNLTLHLEGDDANLRILAKNWFYQDRALGLTCLAIRVSDDGQDHLEAGKLGSFLQQDMLVTFDLAKEAVSFLSI